eukprot:TRINITY_DN115139_c0_g1_i1.p1 TRINITY_DN115139_c0_g1~~TRINITY_DN115139_c0_g1_i1.p1  ORF type:complete len:401 (+),score=29.30 TRINITY_DN115139_c0_g1_i1:106-1308(+)
MSMFTDTQDTDCGDTDAGDHEQPVDSLEDMLRMKQHAHEACMAELIRHLDEFLRRNPRAPYEDWIGDLHPESRRTNTLDGAFAIDHRYYCEESDHRKAWNARVDSLRFVAPKGVGGISVPAGLFAGQNVQAWIPPRQVDSAPSYHATVIPQVRSYVPPPEGVFSRPVALSWLPPPPQQDQLSRTWTQVHVPPAMTPITAATPYVPPVLPAAQAQVSYVPPPVIPAAPAQVSYIPPPVQQVERRSPSAGDAVKFKPFRAQPYSAGAGVVSGQSQVFTVGVQKTTLPAWASPQLAVSSSRSWQPPASFPRPTSSPSPSAGLTNAVDMQSRYPVYPSSAASPMASYRPAPTFAVRPQHGSIRSSRDSLGASMRHLLVNSPSVYQPFGAGRAAGYTGTIVSYSR